jgi:hypothetical protein
MLAINQRLLRQVFKRGSWCRSPINRLKPGHHPRVSPRRAVGTRLWELTPLASDGLDVVPPTLRKKREGLIG